MRVLTTLFAMVAVVTSIGHGLARPQTSPRAVEANVHHRFPQERKVAVLVLENRSYEQVIGNADAPYLTHLARTYALDTHFYAVAHPSLPNYIALTGGSTSHIHTDCRSCHTRQPNLVNQLDAAKISWRGYFQSIPHTGSSVVRAGPYSAHYNPFTYFDSVRGSAADRARILSFGHLRRDLRAHSLPRLSWIAPDLAHDGHNNSVRGSDRYTSHLVPRILRALGPHGLLFVTWDEGSRADVRGLHGSGGGGRVALIAAGPAARRHHRSRQRVDDFALLRSLEAGFSLPALGHASARSTPLLTGLVRHAHT